MKIKSIFIANLAEVARPLTRFMSQTKKEEEIFEDHALCDRCLFSDQDNRVLVTPFTQDKQFVKDIFGLLSFKNTHIFHPKKLKDSICKSVLDDKKLLDKLTEIIEKNPGLKIHSYAATSEFLELVSFFKKKRLSFKTPELPRNENLWIVNFLDSKAGFRQIVSCLGDDFPPMPTGAICHRFDEILGWANHFFKKGKGFVLKTNRGLAGAGLKIVRKEELKRKNLPLFLKSILKSQPFWTKEPVIVEEFIPPNLAICGGAPNIELKIDDKEIKPLYICGMRITEEGIFKGVEIGKKAVPERISKTLVRAGKNFGEVLSHFGYRGFFEIDFVYGKGNKLYPLEANLRRTGGTHVYELGKRILGKDFLRNYYLVANNIIDAPRFKNKDYTFAKTSLSQFLFSPRAKKEGVILTVLNLLKKGKLGYVVIGPNRERVWQTEKAFLEQLTD